MRSWIAVFLILGALARLVRYALCFPLWSDEAFLAASFIDRGYLDMFRPLEYHQVCPLGFLWAELTAVKLFGFCEYSLRLFPLVCSLGSLLVFRHMAGRLFSGAALVLAVGIFSLDYPGIRYAAEAKPYGCDLLVSLAMLALLVQWWQQPERTRWLWALAAAAPLAIGFSYPAVFMAGGISLAAAWVFWSNGGAGAAGLGGLQPGRGREFRRRLFLVYPGPKCGAGDDAQILERDGLIPALGFGGEVLAWLAATHTGEMLAHPVGGPHSASILTFLCCTAALVWLCRRRQLVLPLICAAALALNFAAAALHRFPYAGHVRMAMYLTPLVCLLAGLGLVVLAARLPRRRARAWFCSCWRYCRSCRWRRSCEIVSSRARRTPTSAPAISPAGFGRKCRAGRKWSACERPEAGPGRTVCVGLFVAVSVQPADLLAASARASRRTGTAFRAIIRFAACVTRPQTWPTTGPSSTPGWPR